MGDAGEIHLQIEGTRSEEADDRNGTSPATAAPSPPSVSKRVRWWAVVIVNIVLVLGGQSVATLLGRIYYDQGGNSMWMATLVQSCGTPLAIPLLLYFRRKPNKSSGRTRPPLLVMSAIYAGLGVLLAGDNLMYSYALLYLPLSTYSLICATQLSFNAVFSYFINKEKFTALILNSVVLLTFSAALVGVSHGSDSTNSSVPEGKFPVGFVLTLSASAVFSLILSLNQLTFDRVLKSDTFYDIMEMQFWSNTAAAAVSVAGLFISGEWGALGGEMHAYKAGKAAYGMTLAGTAVSWQLTTMGMMGLVAAVSSLFTNVISTVGMPLSPVVAVIFLGDSMDGVKVLAMLIGLWGFFSYIYQHYLDDAKVKKILAEGIVTSADDDEKLCWGSDCHALNTVHTSYFQVYCFARLVFDEIRSMITVAFMRRPSSKELCLEDVHKLKHPISIRHS